VGKICRSFSLRHDVAFLGWNKTGSAVTADLGAAKIKLFNYETANSRATPIGLFLYLTWLVGQLFKLKVDCVYCVNEDLAFFIGPLKWIFRFKVVCDIFDPIADRKTGSRFYLLYFLIQRAGRFISDWIVVTDSNRYDIMEGCFKGKTSVVQNYPECSSVAVAPNGVIKESGLFYVAYVGSLSKNRGVRHLAECLERHPWLRILCAGWLYDDAAKQFVKDGRVQYFGVVGAEESRGIMAESDLVFCVYDPAVVNNVNASPNKIYDAISVGKKVAINKGIRVADFVVRNGFGVIYDYADAGSLSSVICSCKDNLDEYRRKDEKFIDLCAKEYSWESQLNNLYFAIENR